MRGEIICIGDELITGKVPERNAGYAAARLWPLGIEVGAVVIVGDDPPAIRDALVRALKRADFIIVSGGLGTTEDDITAGMAAEVFGLDLEESERMVANLRAALAARGRRLSDDIRRMAVLPAGAEILCPDCAGFKLSGPRQQPVYFLPGVPSEMRRITDETVVPQLTALAGAGRVVVSRELRTFGLPESEIGGRLAGMADANSRVGYYPRFPEVALTFTAWAGDEVRAEERAQGLADEARRRLGDHVVAAGGLTLEEGLAQDLTERGLTLALAESCTGGLIAHRLTRVPGSSAFFERGMVTYSNRAKEELLGVSPQTLAEHGAVSGAVAAEMAAGARSRSDTDLGLAVTGIAGPTGGSADKPVGTVFFGLAAAGRVRTGGRRFHGDRHMIQAQAAEEALDWLRRYLADDAFLRCP